MKVIDMNALYFMNLNRLQVGGEQERLPPHETLHQTPCLRGDIQAIKPVGLLVRKTKDTTVKWSKSLVISH